VKTFNLIHTMRTISVILFFLLCACGNSANTASSTEADNPAGTVSASEEAAASQAEAGTPPERRDVLYYYRQLKPPYAPPYALKESGGKWMTRSDSTEEPFEAVVDLKNGFIEIVDTGTGGGDWTYRVVLFRTAADEPVIGITRTFFDGAGIQHSYYFLRPEDPKQLDWTKHTMPSVSGFDFLPDDNAEEEAIVEKLLPVTLELPRYGTSVKAQVYTGLEYIYCRGDENEYSNYCGLFRQVKRKEFMLKWNTTSGKFEKG
jgi:hypothetical protein